MSRFSHALIDKASIKCAKGAPSDEWSADALVRAVRMFFTAPTRQPATSAASLSIVPFPPNNVHNARRYCIGLDAAVPAAQPGHLRRARLSRRELGARAHRKN